MWALPNLSVLNAERLADEFDRHHLWCLLLFPRSDSAIINGLKQNWDAFSQALGTSVHVITLLESDAPNSAKGLRFPEGYNANVGQFCHDLEIRIDELPVLFLLNADDGRGAPYWSLASKDPRDGALLLETLIGDLCESTFGLDNTMDPEAWRNAAARKFLNRQSAREIVRFVRTNRRELYTAVSKVVGVLKAHAF